MFADLFNQLLAQLPGFKLVRGKGFGVGNLRMAVKPLDTQPLAVKILHRIAQEAAQNRQCDGGLWLPCSQAGGVVGLRWRVVVKVAPFLLVGEQARVTLNLEVAAAEGLQRVFAGQGGQQGFFIALCFCAGQCPAGLDMVA